jgi:hypothetical protein
LLDGAHLTPVIALNSMLGVSHETLRHEIAEAVERHGTAEALWDVMSGPACVAVAKYDSSRDLSHTWLPAEARGPGLGLDDKTTMTLLLEEGEYTEPQSVALTQQSKSNWLAKRVEVLTPSDRAREAVRASLNEVVSQVQNGGLMVTYFKPHAWAPAFAWKSSPRLPIRPSGSPPFSSHCALRWCRPRFASHTHSGSPTAWQKVWATRWSLFAPPSTSTWPTRALPNTCRSSPTRTARRRCDSAPPQLADIPRPHRRCALAAQAEHNGSMYLRRLSGAYAQIKGAGRCVSSPGRLAFVRRCTTKRSCLFHSVIA